eukprot:6196646-Pleurochrysis_carterae.AAC.1
MQAQTSSMSEEPRSRESHPTPYPGEVVGENQASRAKANQHRQERKEETYKNKRLRLAQGENGTRRVLERPEPRHGGGEWELPPHREDRVTRRLMEGQAGRGMYRVFKDKMNLAHKEKYAEHPILRLFTQPEEMKNGIYMRMSKEDVAHVKAASGKKLTCDTLNVA